VALGSSGEFPFLSPEEKLEFVAKARELTPDGKLLVAGSGCECWYFRIFYLAQKYFSATWETIELSKEFAKMGADAVLVITPSFFKASMTAEALEQHYFQVCNEIRRVHFTVGVPKYRTYDSTMFCVARSVPKTINTYVLCVGTVFWDPD
jgi:dihydrodipicolinate synthase/N-acetylneuraminate lyase